MTWHTYIHNAYMCWCSNWSLWGIPPFWLCIHRVPCFWLMVLWCLTVSETLLPSFWAIRPNSFLHWRQLLLFPDRHTRCVLWGLSMLTKNMGYLLINYYIGDLTTQLCGEYTQTNSSHLKIGRIPKGNDHLPTINFRVRFGSFREGL